MIIQTDKIVRRIEDEIVRIKEKRTPILCCIGFQDDGSTLSYFRSIERVAEKLGIIVKKERFSGLSSQTVVSSIVSLSRDRDIDGILLSRPIPSPYDAEEIRDALNPEKDIDCITEKNFGRLITDNILYTPPTPGAVMEIIKGFGIETRGKRVVIVGRSDVVGKPLALLLLQKGVDATVTVCHSRTEGLLSHTRTADMLIVAVGIPNFLKSDMVKPGTVVIDVGINLKNGKIVGDVDFEEVKKVAGMITPTPGGVGPVTTRILLLNVVKGFKVQGSTVQGSTVQEFNIHQP